MIKKVKIVHAETGQESEVVESSVNAWATVGWTRADDEGDQETAVEEPNKAAPPAEVKVVKTNGGPAVPDTSKKE